MCVANRLCEICSQFENINGFEGRGLRRRSVGLRLRLGSWQRRARVFARCYCDHTVTGASTTLLALRTCRCYGLPMRRRLYCHQHRAAQTHGRGASNRILQWLCHLVQK